MAHVVQAEIERRLGNLMNLEGGFALRQDAQRRRDRDLRPCFARRRHQAAIDQRILGARQIGDALDRIAEGLP